MKYKLRFFKTLHRNIMSKPSLENDKPPYELRLDEQHALSARSIIHAKAKYVVLNKDGLEMAAEYYRNK